jgi:protein ImuA
MPLAGMLGGISDRGAIHDWMASPQSGKPGPSHSPALDVLLGVVGMVLIDQVSTGRVLWIGRRCWPYPPSLVGQSGYRRLLERSVFVDTPTRDERLWAIDVALRSSAALVVVADGAGLTMAGSRRLQLAAEAGGTVGLLARPHNERGELSTAATRWLVSPGPVDGADPARPTWTVELLRRKGLRPIAEDARRWAVRLEDGTRLVSMDATAPDRPAAARGPDRWAAQRSG